MNNVSFYVKATVNYTDSSRCKGGYFSYSDKKESDCLVAIKSKITYKWLKKLPDVIKTKK